MFLRIRPEFKCLKKYDQNSNSSKNKVVIPMLREIGPEFQCLQWKDKIRIRVFITIRPGFQCFEE